MAHMLLNGNDSEGHQRLLDLQLQARNLSLEELSLS